MPGLKDFTTETFSPRTSIRKAATYTVLLTDEYVEINGTYTMTLPVISTMQGTTTHKKVIMFKNIHATGIGTIAAGTGNTIGGRASITLQPGESVIISSREVAINWTITSQFPMPIGMRNIVCLFATTSGTTAQHLIDASGCTVTGVIVDVQATALDTNAGNVTVKNTTDTVCAFAKSTTAGLVTGSTTLTTPQMAVGDTLTVESSSTNGNANVRVYLSTQSLVK